MAIICRRRPGGFACGEKSRLTTRCAASGHARSGPAQGVGDEVHRHRLLRTQPADVAGRATSPRRRRGGNPHPGEIAEHVPVTRWVSATGSSLAVVVVKAMHPQPRAFDAKAGLPPAKTNTQALAQEAGLTRPEASAVPTAVTSPRARMTSPMMMDCPTSPPSEDDHDEVAGLEMGFVQPLAKPARAGGADLAARHQCLPAPAAEIDIVDQLTTSCWAKNSGRSSSPRRPAATGRDRPE